MTGFTQEQQDFIIRLYETYHKQIYDYLYHKLQNEEEAWDIMQDVFMVALNKIDSVMDAPNKQIWLYATAKNYLHKKYDRDKKNKKLITAIGLDLKECEDPHEDYDIFDYLEEVLTPKEFHIVCERYKKDKSNQQIAKEMNKSPSAISSAFNRIYNKLRQQNSNTFLSGGGHR